MYMEGVEMSDAAGGRGSFAPPGACGICSFVYKQEAAHVMFLLCRCLRRGQLGCARSSAFRCVKCAPFLRLALVKIRLVPEIQFNSLAFLKCLFIEHLAPCYILYRHAAYRIKYDLLIALTSWKSAAQYAAYILHT